MKIVKEQVKFVRISTTLQVRKHDRYLITKTETSYTCAKISLHPSTYFAETLANNVFPEPCKIQMCST